MKTKIVLWGVNDQDQKVLLASELFPKTAEVVTNVFPESTVTEEFSGQLMKEWRNGKEVALPADHVTVTTELSLTKSFLPEGIKPDQEDLIQRAMTEWQFIILSNRLKVAFEGELDEFQDKVKDLGGFSNHVWEELKAFWNKIQDQVRDRNLFREHADDLRQRTNDLFNKLKEMRRNLDHEFGEKSKVYVEEFNKHLDEIEAKAKEGLSLQPLFDELKKIQKSFNETKFTREDRTKVWNKLDHTFKTIKEKRFGSPGKTRPPQDRLKRRYDGLLNAIGKMQKSIERDQLDLEFENRKIATTQGQLEAQIRKAKIQMIEERIRSKNEKLLEMNKTKSELEGRMEQESKRYEEREEKRRIEDTKKEIKEKIAAEIKEAAEERKKLEDKLEHAAHSIKGDEKIIPPVILSPLDQASQPEAEDAASDEPPDESLLDIIGESITETLEDVSDNLKAVTKVVGEKIHDIVDDFIQSTDLPAEEDSKPEGEASEDKQDLA